MGRLTDLAFRIIHNFFKLRIPALIDTYQYKNKKGTPAKTIETIIVNIYRTF